MHYILDENKNVISCSLLVWADFMENFEKRIVKQETINDKFISTVFLGLDHGCPELSRPGEPYNMRIFETMVFPNKTDLIELYCDRYPTWQEAEEGHEKAKQWVLDGCKDD